MKNYPNCCETEKKHFHKKGRHLLRGQIRFSNVILLPTLNKYLLEFCLVRKQSLLLKVQTTQNHPKPSKTTQNHPKPPKTTQNHPQPPTSSQKPPTTSQNILSYTVSDLYFKNISTRTASPSLHNSMSMT